MKQRKVYGISCSGLIALLFALWGIGTSANDEIIHQDKDVEDVTQTTFVSMTGNETSQTEIYTTTEKCEETKKLATSSVTTYTMTATKETTCVTEVSEANQGTDYLVQTDDMILKTESLEAEVITTEVITVTTEEVTEPLKKTEEKPQESEYYDYLIIDWQEIQFARLPATQNNVDGNDVVLDTSVWSTEKDKYFFGHNMRSFHFLHYVEVGDIIKFYDGNEEKLYIVERSEQGELTDDETNITSNIDGVELVNTDLGYETIRLITCVGQTKNTKKRWVVIARKI